jgi:His-Xaa-Ser system radical SAM maturase HxsB
MLFQSVDKIKLDKEVGMCRFEKIGGKYLLTNDVGRFIFLDSESFKNFLEGELDKNGDLYRKLKNDYFIKTENPDELAQKYQQRNAFLFRGPSLHIAVVTLRCNHNCLYCQVSSRNTDDKKYDMTPEVARKVVDNAFKSPSPAITIEFQGGEPLLNWPVIKTIVQYAKEKNEQKRKSLSIAMVSNFSLMDEQKCNFLLENRVAVNTSLDGPEELHNKNRIWLAGNSYGETIKWIKKIREKEKENPALPKIGALTTISKHSLEYPEEIVNEYLKFGFKEVHLRPLSYLGLSGKLKNQIGYSPEEFMSFWKKAMDYIIKKNLEGKYIHERGSRIILQKILTDNDPNYLDLRSPCGAGIGQITYDYDGKVFTCDEGRMLGNDAFLIGNINTDEYGEIASHPTIKTVCTASLLENLPCDNCVFKPYCGTCPVQNYALYGNIFAQMPNSERCKIQKEIFKYLFSKLSEEKTRKVFESWLS